MSRQQAKTQLRLLEETQKSFSVFNLRCYSMCPFSSPVFHTTHLQQRLQTCQASPTHQESSHLRSDALSTFQWISLQKGLRHLKLSAKTIIG